MRKGPALAVMLALASCATTEPAGVKVITKEVLKEVPRPCPAERPKVPAKLQRPLPTDPARLVDLLVAKLTEWAGPGGYGERANAALDLCTKP